MPAVQTIESLIKYEVLSLETGNQNKTGTTRKVLTDYDKRKPEGKSKAAVFPPKTKPLHFATNNKRPQKRGLAPAFCSACFSAFRSTLIPRRSTKYRHTKRDQRRRDSTQKTKSAAKKVTYLSPDARLCKGRNSPLEGHRSRWPGRSREV